ncbi:MAG: DUF3098 domain-containing protein [Bacteroidaceae bacterium]|nr:DUF3098 domain-containing protein [Bacteroidaceae bacterium]
MKSKQTAAKKPMPPAASQSPSATSPRSASPRPATSRWHTAFRWQNYALTSLSVLLIVAGFVLMLPPVDIRNTVGGRYAPCPGPGAFEARRIRAAPIPCFVGFVLMVPAIMYVPRERGKGAEKASEM